MANFIGSSASHISQVLSGKTSLTPEQALATADFIKLSSLEKDYFLNLVHHSRAGTQDLKKYYKGLLEGQREKYFSVSGRLKSDGAEFTEEFKAKYYSSWLYLGVHLAVQLPSIKNETDLSEYLNIGLSEVENIVEFLIENGAIVRTKSGLSSTPKNIFLDKSSPFLNEHHLNWRVKSMEKIQMRSQENIHYSAAFSVSKSTARKIKQSILDLIQTNVGLIQDSKEEEIFVFTSDFYRI